MHTYVFAGASGRALYMYAHPMLKDFPEDCKILGVYDINYVKPAKEKKEKASAADEALFEQFKKWSEAQH